MKKGYMIEKRTTKGWCLLEVKKTRLGAWWYARKYLKQHKGSALRYYKTEYR